MFSIERKQIECRFKSASVKSLLPVLRYRVPGYIMGSQNHQIRFFQSNF